MGVDTFCFAPGFRNAPLVISAVEHPKTKVYDHYDERGAAFFALGYARATSRPACWITTSGSATTHGLPAVVEADADQVPMMLLTADRPPELQSTGANQTMDQQELFAPYVRWKFNLPVPSEKVAPTFVLTTIAQAHYMACSATKGPVHLNCMFREPLVNADAVTSEYLAPLRFWNGSEEPFTINHPSQVASNSTELVLQLSEYSRVLMVLGRLKDPADAQAALELARVCGWPVFADINSQLSPKDGPDVLINAFDACLEHTVFSEAHAPEAVVYLGAPGVSKKLMLLLYRCKPKFFLAVHEGHTRLDPTHQVTHRLRHNVASLCSSWATLIWGREIKFDHSWLRSWRNVNSSVKNALSRALTSGRTISEPFVACSVSHVIPKEHILVLGNSMPVRDMNRFGSSARVCSKVICNRGVSGIDGTIATAAGAARGGQVPVTVIVGDLALLHDMNSLALIRDLPVTIVVLNNDGGGIFHLLDMNISPDLFERCFGSAHGMHFEHAAKQFSLSYSLVLSCDQFIAVYSEACLSGRPSVLEVLTNRTKNRSTHEYLSMKAIAAVDSVFNKS